MTTRLYYNEPYRTSFDAVVTRCAPAGDRYHVLLDATAFYPTSGGQPFDVGTLGNRAVLDVIDRDDGEVVHVVDGALREGERVEGAIDWTRRFDHMQQHTGQHVLSAAFERLFASRTESFHLGATAATIDLGREVSLAEIRVAEDEANRIVWADRPVAIRFVTAEEAASLPLRKEPTREGTLRLIDIEEFDLSACGGTHVARTGAIGIIAVTAWEKFRSGTRIEFLCGGRALARLRVWRDALGATMRYLSVAPEELAGAIDRMQSEAKAQQRTIRGLQEQLAGHEARALLARGQHAGEHLVVCEALEGWDATGLKALAVAAAAADSRGIVALFSQSTPALVVIARGREASVDAASVLKQLTSQFGGKGGGKPDLAQGGGLNAAAGELCAAARQLIAGQVE